MRPNRNNNKHPTEQKQQMTTSFSQFTQELRNHSPKHSKQALSNKATRSPFQLRSLANLPILKSGGCFKYHVRSLGCSEGIQNAQSRIHDRDVENGRNGGQQIHVRTMTFSFQRITSGVPHTAKKFVLFTCTAIDARQNVGSTKMNPSPKATLRK